MSSSAISAKRCALRKTDSRGSRSYLLDPKPDEFATWAAEFDNAVARSAVRFLSFDIETPFKLKAQDEDEIGTVEDEGSDASARTCTRVA